MTSNLDRHVAALAADPSDERAFVALEEGYFLAAEWDKLAALYRHRLDDPNLVDPSIRAPLHFRLGQILEERCLEIDHAIQQYTEAIQIDPTCGPALRQLRKVHASREAWDLVLQIAEVEIETLSERYERAAFFAEMGHVWLRHIEDTNEAMSCFEQALGIDPEHKMALAGLARTLQAQGQPEAAAATWERLIGCVRGPDRAAPLVALATLLAGPLHQGERSVELYRRALGDDPRNENAVEALSVSAAARGQWELLSDLFERRFSLASGARRRTAIALEAGHMHLEQLGNADAARIWFERAHEMSGDDVAVLSSLADLERLVGTEDTLIQALEGAIAAAGPAPPLRLLLEAASLLSERGDDERALRHLEIAQRQYPGDPLVLEALATAYGNVQRYEDLAAVLELRASLSEADPAEAANVLVELGSIQALHLSDAEAAQDAYERAFAIRPATPGLAATLESLYRKTESWDVLRALLERAREQASEAERGAFHCSLGELLEEHFGELEESERCYEAALDLEPTSRALKGLSRLAERSDDPDALLRALEREAAMNPEPGRLAEVCFELSGRYEERGDLGNAQEWAQRAVGTSPDDPGFLGKLADIQERLGLEDGLRQTLARLESMLRGPEQSAVRRRMAAVQERLGETDAALGYWESSLEAQPESVESLAALRRHYRERGRAEDLAPVLRKLADLSDPPQQVELLDELCTVLDEQLCDLDGAIVVMWRLSNTPGRPENVGTRLETLLERAGRFEELAQQLLETRRGLAEDSDDAIEIDLRRAQLLLDPLGQFEEAVREFRAVRVRAPGREEATAGLERALRAANDSAGLARLLLEMADAADDTDQRERLHFERAVLLEESLGELEQARQAYTALCQPDTNSAISTQAGTRLESLLERCGDWGSLRERLESSIERCRPGEQLTLHERLATLCGDRMGDQEGCALHLEAAGRLDPSRPDPWRSLSSLYRQLDRPNDLLRVTQLELEAGTDRDRERVLHARAASLWIQQPGEEERAGEHYERLLELEPGRSDATEFLITRYEEQRRHADVVRLLEGRLEAVSLPERGSANDPNRGLQHSLRLRIGTLCAEQLDDPVRAIAALEPTLAELGPTGPATEPLAGLYKQTRQNDKLVDLCEQAAQACAAAAERAVWLLRLADCLREDGEDAGAAAAYREVLDERPDDPEAFASLCDLYRQGDKPGALADLLDSCLSRISGTEEIAVRMELAKLLEDELGRPIDALGHLQRIIALEGNHEAAFQHALHLAEQLGRHEEGMQLLDARLERGGSSEERADLLERRANLLAGPLSSPEAAVSTLREVIALDPQRRSARASLREALERLGRWTAVLDCLYVDADSADPEERVQIYERAVEVATAQVGPDAALPWLERLRSLRSRDPLIVARIADVHRLAGRFEAVLRALEDELALTTDLDHKRDLHVGRARIFERDMRAPGRAIAALEAARSLAPRDPAILEKLDGLYDLSGRAKERAEVLEGRIEVAEGDPLQLHLAAAELYSDTLANPAAASHHLLRAVFLTRTLLGGIGESAFATPEARIALLEDLASTLRAAGRDEASARATEAELTVLLADLETRPRSSDPDPRQVRRAEIHRDLAWLYAEHLANHTAALDHMRTSLDLAESTDSPGLAPEERDRLECSLLDLLRQDSNWVELEERLAARLDRGEGGADDWLELGRLRDERLHAPQAAFDAYSVALTHRPSCLPAIRGLRDLAERLANWSEVARALDLEVALPDRCSPHEQAALYRRLGEVCWRRTHALERAIGAYGAALEADPSDLQALRSLQELHQVQEQWHEAISLHEREAEILGGDEPERRQEVWLVAAGLAATRTSEPGRALRAYEEAARISRLRAEDLRIQADLYQQTGALEKFAETYGAWCDDPAAGATSAEHLAGIPALVELGRQDGALERARRASEVDDENPDAWVTLARLHHERGRLEDAADAWERAGEVQVGPEAADYLTEAALLTESRDASLAVRRLRRAVELDAASANARCQLSRVAHDLEIYEEAEQAAARGLNLAAAGAGTPVGEDVLLETALVGGRAARELDRLESAGLFFGVALDFEEAHEEALEAYGEVLFERGDLAAARGALEARLEGGPDERRGDRLAMLASVLELQGEDAEALERFQEAIAAEPACTPGHAGIARLCEKAGRTDEAIDALERWAAVAETNGDTSGCAARLLQAAELEIANERYEGAETHLRRALDTSSQNPRAWVLLAEILSDDDKVDEMLRLAPEALAGDALSADAIARLSLLHARALERGDDPAAACDAYAAAVRNDPRCAEAALAQARLLRTRGDWTEAASTLRSFCEEHPEPDHRDLSEAHYKLARLLAGPLEDMDGALRAFERVLEIAPDHTKAREPLASLLAVMPDRWSDAIVHHAALLEEQPTRSPSFRALCEIAQGRGQDDSSRFGLAVLRAIGTASPDERREAPDLLPRAIVATPSLEDPIGELARRALQQAGEVLDQVLAGPDGDSGGTRESTEFAARMREAQRDVSAIGLERFSDEELGDLVCTLAAFSLGDEAEEPANDGHLDSRLVGTLDRALGRWTRRKIRRCLDGTSLDQLRAIDFGAWRVAVGGLAAAVAVDASQGDLRAAFVTLCQDGDDPASAGETEDWTARIQGEPVADELLRRVAASWCTELIRS